MDSRIQDHLDRLFYDRPGDHRMVLQKAVEWAIDAHHGQERASGEPYYSHALAVAEILTELKLDYETLAAAMLHDVVEDTDVTLEQVRAEFGPVIARLVDGVTRMERIGEFQEKTHAGRDIVTGVTGRVGSTRSSQAADIGNDVRGASGVGNNWHTSCKSVGATVWPHITSHTLSTSKPPAMAWPP